jgi:hypothetical protein
VGANPRVLQWDAVIILLGHWLDLYVLVAPPVLARVRVSLPELLITAGYASLFFLLLARALGRAPLLARNDPYLGRACTTIRDGQGCPSLQALHRRDTWVSSGAWRIPGRSEAPS